jgi:MHS family proline/betaine transporter-like MFS transporter
MASRRLYGLVIAASLGNALEWFDLLVYAYFAVTLSKLFFPTANETVSLLLTLGTFGASYLARPLGAVVLGSYGDRAGRKASLMISILLMTVGTFLTAIMPTYASIGIVAPVGILLARLMQGFSVGGEFGSSTAFLVEHGPERRGYLASFQWAGQGLAAFLSSAFGVALTTLLTTRQLESWGWRLPYFFGLLIGPIGFYIRRHMEETPEFLQTKTTHTPVRDLFAQQWDRVLLAIGAVIVSTSSTYLLIYMPTYAIKQLHLPQSTGFTATLTGAAIVMFGAPVIGHWSDKVGRSRIMLAATALFLVSVYPVYAGLTAYPTLAVIILAVVWISILKTAYSGALPAFMAEIFPAKTRVTGLSISYNISVPLFGGFAPFYITSLIALTHSNMAPSFYMIFTAVLGLLTLLLARNRLRIP